MADFVASYIAGAAAIILGNPIDVIKVRLQTGAGSVPSTIETFNNWSSLLKGAAAPVLGNAALNAVLFVGYNRSLEYLENNRQPIPHPSLTNVWVAGAFSGLACFFISAPIEIIKCRTQVFESRNVSSWNVARDILRTNGLRGFYSGGVITSLRDSIGYGWYFWSYEGCKRILGFESEMTASLVGGGIAGCVTWASIYPLDVIKTRVQTQQEPWPLAPSRLPTTTTQLIGNPRESKLGAMDHAKIIYRTEGLRGYFSGFWWCMGRSFFVNAVQWALYEYIMRMLTTDQAGRIKEDLASLQDQKYSFD